MGEKMYISEISIENFKSIQRIKITPNREFNIIIGANNIGKSSIFEALALWKKCYELSITKSNSVFYKKEGNNYINFNDLSFLRFQKAGPFLHSATLRAISMRQARGAENGKST